MAKNLTQIAIDNLKPGPARREVPDGKEGGLYLVIQPSGSMSWALRYRFEGKPRKFTIGPYPAIGLAKARAETSKAKSAIADGVDPAAQKTAAKRAEKASQEDESGLVEKAVETFIARYAKPKQKEATAYETERVLTKEIVGRWRGRPLSKITKADVHDLLDSIVDRGSPIQANRTLAALRRMCGWAVERGLLAASPCAGIKAPAAERSRDRVLTDDELKAVWQASEAIGWPFGPLVRLLILTGQRRSEIAEMRWQEIDFDKRIWTLPRERSKNAQAHSVSLSGQVIEILESLPRVSGKPGYVFTINGETSVSGFAKAKERLDTKLPQGMADWTLHDLRRTFTSGAARLGVAVHVLEAALNHKSGAIRGVAAVYNRYSYDAEKRACLETWGRYLEAIVTGETAQNVIELATAARA
jgi:integrase